MVAVVRQKIHLSSCPDSRSQLLQTRAWFDFPLLLNGNRMAKLVLQKSSEGDAMLAKAFEAWKSETPSAAPEQEPKTPQPHDAPAGAPALPLLSADTAATQSPPAGGNADTRYFTIVYSMIRSHLRAPPGQRATNRGGAIVFTVDAGGKLVRRKLVSPSGSPGLDTAVMTAIVEAAPYPAPPNWQPRSMRLTYGK
jgi:TonB family protein